MTDRRDDSSDIIPDNTGSCEIVIDSVDCFGTAYQDPILKEEYAQRALLNGFIALDHLVGFLAQDKGLARSLPTLWGIFECSKMPGAPETADFSDPILAWRKLVHVWAGFVDPVTAKDLAENQRLQAYDYVPTQMQFIAAKDRVYPEFVQYLRIEEIEQLFQRISLLLKVDLRLHDCLIAASYAEGQDKRITSAGEPDDSQNVAPVEGIKVDLLSFFEKDGSWFIGELNREENFNPRGRNGVRRVGFDRIHHLVEEPHGRYFDLSQAPFNNISYNAMKMSLENVLIEIWARLPAMERILSLGSSDHPQTILIEKGRCWYSPHAATKWKRFAAE